MIRVLRETKQTPKDIERRVTLAGGRNRFGEPNFRVVWGWSRLGWIGGKWEDHDADGGLVREVVELREEPKYFPHERWHVERWMPPEAYGSPADWYRHTIETSGAERIPALGPYPVMGDWEHCFTIQTPKGEFLPLTPAICEEVVRRVERSRAQPKAAGMAALRRREEKRQKNYEDSVDRVLWDEPRFHAQPYVVVA
ncbi:MAG TPA: hypothetical protein VNJ12_06605 [Candidatus Dormibacteraeota bacterium]|nr:hypothetical protein [Candidatus Dormibacteraeota bacterium]